METADRRFFAHTCLFSALLGAFALAAGAAGEAGAPVWATQRAPAPAVAMSASTSPASPTTGVPVYALKPIGSSDAPDVAAQPPVTPPELDVAGVAPPSNPAGKWVYVTIDLVTSIAKVELYQDGKLISTLWGYGGPLNAPTLVGLYRVTGHLGTIHTSLYKQSLGHDFFLPYFLQFKGDYGFHGFKVNDVTGQAEPTPTHGCVTLSNQDVMLLNAFALDGTPIFIQYGRFDPGPPAPAVG